MKKKKPIDISKIVQAELKLTQVDVSRSSKVIEQIDALETQLDKFVSLQAKKGNSQANVELASAL